MWELQCKNKITNELFSKWFYDKWNVSAFIKKCEHSKKILVQQILKY